MRSIEQPVQEIITTKDTKDTKKKRKGKRRKHWALQAFDGVARS
jgi:hypothetical protein